MAGINLTFTTAIKDDADRIVATEANVQTGEASETFEATVPGESEVVIPLTIVAADILAFWILVDAADCTLQTNDDGTPDYEAALTANVPHWWYSGLGDNPISVDITTITVVKSSAGDATVNGGFLTQS